MFEKIAAFFKREDTYARAKVSAIEAKFQNFGLAVVKDFEGIEASLKGDLADISKEIAALRKQMASAKSPVNVVVHGAVIAEQDLAKHVNAALSKAKSAVSGVKKR